MDGLGRRAARRRACRRTLACTARLRRHRTSGSAGRVGPRRRLVRLERLPGPDVPSRRRSPPPTPRSTAGAPGRARPASSPAAARSTASSSTSWRPGRAPSGPCCSPPGSPPTSVCSPRSPPPAPASCSDELNHASIIDGARLARADVTIWPHHGLDELDAMLGDRSTERSVVVSDSVFSMDGDAADVERLLGICRRHRALLVLDEAHAVLGPEPSPDALDEVDVIRVGTLSKATRRARRLRGDHRSVRRSAGERGPLVHLHDRAQPRRRRRRAGRHPHPARRRRARRSAIGCATSSIAWHPATRRRSCRSSSATSPAPSRHPRRCSSAATGAGHPSAHRCTGNQPSSCHALCGAHRRAGRRAAVGARRPQLPSGRPAPWLTRPPTPSGRPATARPRLRS